MIKNYLIISSLLFILNTDVSACGTTKNWMDTYERIESGNKWRDSMNKMESLVMILGCGRDYQRLNIESERRLYRILSDALLHKRELLSMRSNHSEISSKVNFFRNAVGFDSLIESIYRRFKCLTKLDSSNKLKKRFGNELCGGGDVVWKMISASSGARVRSQPDGKVMLSLKHGTKVRVIGLMQGWYRIYLPRNKYEMNGSTVAYLHKSVVSDL